MKQFKEAIAGVLAGHVPLSADEVESALTTPPRPDMGDLAFPCFSLAKTMRKAPNAIAQELAGKVSAGRGIAQIKAIGPYLNFFIEKAKLVQSVLHAVEQQGAEYGRSEIGRGKTVVIDFSSPNIAKHLSVGHLRSTVIGKALYRIHSFVGYHVVGINHLGDWGTQFGQLFVAFRRWGSEERLAQEPIKELNEIYVRFHEEAKSDASLMDEAREWFKRLEDGEPEAKALWEQFRSASLTEFQKAYDRLDVDFDSYSGESFFNDKMDATVARIEAKGIAHMSEGALVVDVGDDIPPCLLRRKDGATLYATRDICAAEYRRDTYKCDRILYVVGSPQKLHFRQVFKVLEMMGYEWAKHCVHVDFGQILFGDGGKMSSRKGNVVLLNDVLDEAVSRALQTIEDKNPGLEDKVRVAEAVGIGAVVFADLSNRRIKDVTFSWDEILNFEGETGPYVQYTHVRTCSVLEKHGRPVDPSADLDALAEPEEAELAKTLGRFAEVVLRADEENEPSAIARYLLDLCSQFNNYYHKHRVLGNSEGLTNARVVLVDCVRQVLANGIRLLGLGAPEKM